MTPLTRSARVYRAMLTRLPALTDGALRTAPYQDAADYLRELYREFGRSAARRAIETEAAAALIDTSWLDC